MGIWYGSMVGYAFVCIARMVSPEHRLVCLLYAEGLCMSLYPLSACHQMDLICRCLISVSVMICVEGCA